MEMLTFNDFAKDLKDICPESVLFAAVPKSDVDFVTDLVKQQTDEVLENFCSVYDQISKLVHFQDFLQIYFSTCQKKKYQKFNY